MGIYETSEETEELLKKLKHMFEVDTNAEVLLKCVALAKIIEQYYTVNANRENILKVKYNKNVAFTIVLNK